MSNSPWDQSRELKAPRAYVLTRRASLEQEVKRLRDIVEAYQNALKDAEIELGLYNSQHPEGKRDEQN